MNATWNLAYRNERMRMSLPRLLLEIIGGPVMANHAPAGPASFATGHVGGVRRDDPPVQANTTDSVDAGQVPTPPAANSENDPKTASSADMRDAA